MQILTTQQSYVFIFPLKLFKLAGSMVKHTEGIDSLPHFTTPLRLTIVDFYNIMSHKHLQTTANINLSQLGLSRFCVIWKQIGILQPHTQVPWVEVTHSWTFLPKAIKTSERKRTWSVIIMTIYLSIWMCSFFST